MHDNPDHFRTFMLCLLAEIFQTLLELGNPEKPRLVIFIDESHLIFRNASKILLDQFEKPIKLIRSKWVGFFFINQSPGNIPAEILGQLGGQNPARTQGVYRQGPERHQIGFRELSSAGFLPDG